MLSIDLLRYPRRGDHGGEALAVSGVCTLGAALALRVGTAAYPSVLAVPLAVLAVLGLVALAGYLGRVLAATLAGDDAPPAAGRPRDLLATGARACAVAAVYTVGPTIVLLVTVRGTALVSGGPGPAGGLVVALGATVTLLLALSVLYLLPAAVAAALTAGRVRAGLAPGNYRPVLSHGAYFVGWVGAFTAAGLWIGAFATAAGSASVGGLLATAVAVYVGIVGARMAGLGYARATGRRH